jgi:hypothetical protein
MKFARTRQMSPAVPCKILLRIRRVKFEEGAYQELKISRVPILEPQLKPELAPNFAGSASARTKQKGQHSRPELSVCFASPYRTYASIRSIPFRRSPAFVAVFHGDPSCVRDADTFPPCNNPSRLEIVQPPAAWCKFQPTPKAPRKL